MKTAMLNVKINPDLKSEAQMVAEELGLPLSAIINATIKDLVRTRSVSFTVLEPTPLLKNAIKKSRIERIKNKPKVFTSTKSMMAV